MNNPFNESNSIFLRLYTFKMKEFLKMEWYELNMYSISGKEIAVTKEI